uniref:Uncharacterized protein n=1 Tax=mine drainage metagenome TaxID=410659 RepID=E6PZH1_9ZZZZ
MLRNGIVLAAVLLVFPALILSLLSGFMASGRKRAAADQAIYDAQSSPRMAAVLGLPMIPGWPIRGEAWSRHGKGAADLEIPLSGPLGKGVLFEHARQREKQWSVCSLEFHAAAGQVVTLVNASQTQCSAK